MRAVELNPWALTHSKSSKPGFTWRVFITKLRLVARVIGLLIVAVLAGYVACRHWVYLKRLPPVTWQPIPLAVPLSEDTLLGEPVRWVEIEATAAPTLAERKTLYRNTVESAGTLILHFKSDPDPPGRQKYRGILQTYRTRRAKYRFPSSLEKALHESGIVPSQRFAVLSVDQSAWSLQAPRIKERAIIASGACLVLFFLFHAVWALVALWRPIARAQWIAGAGDDDIARAWPARCARCGRIPGPDTAGTDTQRNLYLPLCLGCQQRTGPVVSKIQRLATVIAVWAVAWALYRSLRFRPVIPAESLMALGGSALLGLMAAVKRWHYLFWHPLLVRQSLGPKRQIKLVLVHKDFLMALAEGVNSPSGNKGPHGQSGKTDRVCNHSEVTSDE